jgi:cytochrome c peroxidase
LLNDPFNSAGAYSDGAKPELGYLVPRQDSSGQFKTPTLRDVARTAPYTHTGQFKTLRDVLRFYSTREDIPRTHGERGVIRRLDLTESQLDDLEAFLKSLNGRPLPNDLLVAPGSPG